MYESNTKQPTDRNPISKKYTDSIAYKNITILMLGKNLKQNGWMDGWTNGWTNEWMD